MKSVDASKSAFKPNIYGVFEIGYQGEGSKYVTDNPLWTASVFWNWNFFNGFQDTYKKKQLKLDLLKQSLVYEEIKKKLEMEFVQLIEAVKVNKILIETSKHQLYSAKKSFEIVNNKFELNHASQLDFSEARVRYTRAGINHIIAQYDYLMKYAELESVIPTPASP